jgi:biopolymer transport protein ExbB/TolQ
LALLLACVALYAVPALAQVPTGEINKISDISTFWSLTKLGGGISIAIFGVLGLGLFLIVMQIYELIMDKMRSKVLLDVNYRQMTIGDVGKLVMKNPNNMTARLYSILLSIFHSTGDTRDFHDEIANYVELQQDRFATFKGRLSFLSDTAGALGLLGTVWGMFATFFGGNLDSQRILNGMGLALVTTLIGLVVSIILNFCATEVFSIFNKRMEMLSSRADEFRLWLMALVKQRNKSSSGGSSSTPNGSSSKRRPETLNTSDGRRMTDLILRPLTDLKQDGTVGHAMTSPTSVEVRSTDGRRASDVPVIFRIVQGDGKLQNLKSEIWSKTDANGIARTEWTLGGQVGPQRLVAMLPNDDDNAIEFVALAQPLISNIDTQMLSEQRKGLIS